MATTITWLHLSDLHACRPNTGWDAQRVLESLRKDLRKLRDQHGLVPDLIFFTGDAAYGHLGPDKGQAIGDQFRVADEFLTAVRKEFSPEIPQRNVFLVPGNHDVNRHRVTRFLSNWLEQEPHHTEKERKLAEIEQIIRDAGPEWRQLTERLRDYRHFLDSAGYDHLLTMSDRLIYADLREVAGVRIGIGGFNSAWSSRGTGRDEIANLWMAGRFQLETIWQALPPRDFAIALVHHPGHWLVPEENQSPKFFDELQRDFAFVLHGHEHDQFVRQDASNHHAVLSAGACHEWSTGKNNGYSFVRLNLERASGEVWLREYESAGSGWRPRVITGKTNDHGVWPLELTKLLTRLNSGATRSAAPAVLPVGDPAPSLSRDADYETRYRKAVVDRLDHMQLFGIDVPRDSKEYPLSIAFVSVNLADDQAEDAEDSDAGDKPRADSDEAQFLETSLPAERFFDKLSCDTRRLLIRGAAGCGKTTLLRWAAVQAGKGNGDDSSQVAVRCEPPAESLPDTCTLAPNSEQDWRQRVPFLIRLRDFPLGQLPRPQDFPLLLAKELPDAPAGWMTNLLEAGRALLLFDGIDEVPEAKRAETIAEIRQLLSTYPRNAFVVTSRTSAVERGDFAAHQFVTARVEALATHDRNELIERWHQAMESHLRQRGEAADLRPLADRLKRRLEQTPAVARLTINPLLCAVVCALHRDREENLPDTPVGLCEKLAEMLLDRRDRERPGIEAERTEDPVYRQLKYAQRRGLLARLAHHMVSAGQSAVPETDALAQIRAGLASYQLDLPEDRVLQLLLERSGLLQESSERTIEFLHNTLKEFLAAERFANGGEVHVLADHCHDDAWQPVILFAVALPREGSDFATQLVRAIRDQTPLQSPPKGRKSEQRKAAAEIRAKQFFFFRCCLTAHQINDANIQNQFQALKDELLPPRTLTDAEALATCGEAVVPYLAYNRDWTAQQRVACVRALRLIGGPLASRFKEEFKQDDTNAVRNELFFHGDDPLSIPGAVELIERHGRLPSWIERRWVTCVSRLAGLISLQTLDLGDTQVSDLSPLAGLVSLQSLSLRGTRVSDVSPLAGLISLQTLDLRDTPVSDVSPLAGLISLQTLSLRDTPVSDVSPLAGLISLQTLSLRGTPVSDVSPLAGLIHLQALSLRHTRVSNVSPLARLTRLQMLNLAFTPVSDVSPLGNLIFVQRLSLRGTQVLEVASLARLTSLQKLSLRGTAVRDEWALSELKCWGLRIFR